MSPNNTLEVNAERLWTSIERSGEIGRFRDTGLRRLRLSREDQEVLNLFVGWAREACCPVEVDPVGNLFARRPGTDDRLSPVAIGSHLDTQMCGGRSDGVLGVMCGLEAIRTLNDRAIQTRRPIELIMCSLFAPECIALLKDTAADLGLPYREMLSQSGHDAYAVADLTPTVMIFTPCRDGISHNTNEAIDLARTLPDATYC